MTDIELYKSFQGSPLMFIEKVWGLVPQSVKPEYQSQVNDLLATEHQAWEEAKPRFKGEWFELFEKGKHLTWQQWLILVGVEKALRNKASKKISVSSGRGIGKDTTLSWLLLWFLFCFKDAQVPCTANTESQLKDVLWKEVSLWHGKMPEAIKNCYEITDGYVRIKERPTTWYARYRTASKDRPEALSGVHADYILAVADEASGIIEETFVMAEGVLTSENVLFILISNPTRLIGYFYDSHHKNKRLWQCFTFNGEESPLVSYKFIQEKLDKCGGNKNADEYRIDVLGQFPKEDEMDDKGYVPLFNRQQVTFIPDEYEFRSTASVDKKLGVDCAGEGKDKTVWVVRDRFVLKKVAEEAISSPKSIAQKTLTLMNFYAIPSSDVFIDGFGIGSKVAQELYADKDTGKVNVILTSDTSIPPFLNVRAQTAMNFASWCHAGGKIIQDKAWEELWAIKYTRNLSGKIKIADKLKIKEVLGRSPDYFDAACLTFIRGEEHKKVAKQWRPQIGYAQPVSISRR